MDRETKDKKHTAPEQEQPERPRRGKRKSGENPPKARRWTEELLELLILGRNGFCRGVRSAFDSVAAFFLWIWTFIGPFCKGVARAVAGAFRAFWKAIAPLCGKVWRGVKPGLLFLGDRIRKAAAGLSARFKGLNKTV